MVLVTRAASFMTGSVALVAGTAARMVPLVTRAAVLVARAAAGVAAMARAAAGVTVMARAATCAVMIAVAMPVAGAVFGPTRSRLLIHGRLNPCVTASVFVSSPFVKWAEAVMLTAADRRGVRWRRYVRSAAGMTMTSTVMTMTVMRGGGRG